ncbi:hypothetical protein [Falsigemmobacter faecalis]|uniref:hypothetical protein n=1 Tax=Falsigemmobacter faecalis TaxID=2488730 RepID=UPI001F1CBA79|nr:hypothetical protein [Falsigemmobacter faecalis]
MADSIKRWAAKRKTALMIEILHGKTAVAADIRIIELTKPYQQVRHYRATIQTFDILQDCDWLLIADLDEFWFSTRRLSLTAELQALEGLDLVYARPANFGACQGEGHPSSLRRELILRRAELCPPAISKWICRTVAIHVLSQVDLHKFHEIDSARTITMDDVFRMNHYQTQSRHYFETVKMSRGDSTTADWDRMRDWAYFDESNRGCDMEDTLLRDLLEAAEAEKHKTKAA